MDKITACDEEKLKNRYCMISKFLLIIAVSYSLWIGFVLLSIYLFGFGYKWTMITLDVWVVSGVILLSFCIVLEILFVVHFSMIHKKRIYGEMPQPIVINGKQVHIFTLPEGASGGVFSKTIIPIDHSMMIMIRYQMLQPQDIWTKKQ